MKQKMLKTILIYISIFLISTLALADDKDKSDPLADVTVDISHTARVVNNEYTQKTEDGRTIKYTVIPKLQKFADDLFAKYDVPAAAAVVINSKTGRVLAISQYRGAKFAADTKDISIDSAPPSASLFKIVTTSALLTKTDVNLNTQMCYHGGGGRLNLSNIIDSPKQDTACRTLKKAFGFSTNAVIAKLSDKYLTRSDLAKTAGAFLYGKKIPFDVPLPVSKIDIPSDRLEKARASAGFWHSYISPLHAAMITQSIAQKGAMLKPYIVDSVTDKDGNVIYTAKPKLIGRPVSKEVAEQLIKAMKVTVAKGTARKGFLEGRTPIVPKGIEVAGKTGTLDGSKPYRAHNWFAGLAPADNPEISIAVIIINSPKWRIKAAWAAAQILRKYFTLKK